MNPAEQPEIPPPMKARVSNAQVQSPQQVNSRQVLTPSESGGWRRSVLQTAILVVFLLGLVALATWGLLSKRDEGQSGAGDALPKDAVALINSSTPIVTRDSPLTIKDTVDDLPYAPESD